MQFPKRFAKIAHFTREGRLKVESTWITVEAHGFLEQCLLLYAKKKKKEIIWPGYGDIVPIPQTQKIDQCGLGHCRKTNPELDVILALGKHRQRVRSVSVIQNEKKVDLTHKMDRIEHMQEFIIRAVLLYCLVQAEWRTWHQDGEERNLWGCLQWHPRSQCAPEVIPLV